MKLEQIKSNKCAEIKGAYALGVKAGNIIFSTQVGNCADGSIAEGGIVGQTKQIFENIKNVLEAVDSSLDKIAKITIYVKDMKDVPAMNEVYTSYFKNEFPARCCIQVAGMATGFVVEMEFVAFI
jgi:2-iminobutanoate/2-iminopropanoate deaminase